LLRGANSEELKKVKQVMLYTVFAAYHLVLETSFFEDQRVILDNHVSAREPPTHGETVITISSKQIDHLNSTDDQSQPKRSFHYQNIYLPVLTSSQEATTDHHRKEAGALQCNQDMVLHTQFGSGENVDHLSSDPQNEGNQHITLLDDHDPWVSGKHDEQPSTPLENVSDVDEVDDVLESQSILILLSSQCITKQVICEQSHLSRINYYGNSDVSLGRYLQDILQNQVKNLFLPLFCLYISFCPTPFGEYAHDSCFFFKYQNLSCSSCGEPPEAHMYSYTHRNGNLTVLVKRLPKYHLPGESQGKIWMWTRCLRCEHESGISRSSPRVVMSTEAHYLSFGKFLELSFSSHSTARRLSICGHSLNKDCLRFFG
jgi:1-phosphatidylinositol-3-phosphate 5-kinase